MPEDAIAMLKADHDAVKGLFAQFDELGDRAFKGKDALARQICRELTIHASIEEDIFYPRVRRAGKEEKNEVLEGIEEHHVIKQLIGELDDMTADEESFDAKMKVLEEQVEHHMKEEEEEMFPNVRKAIDAEELVRLGQQLLAAKRSADAG